MLSSYSMRHACSNIFAIYETIKTLWVTQWFLLFIRHCMRLQWSLLFSDIVCDYNGLQTLSSPHFISFHMIAKPITIYQYRLVVLLPMNSCFLSISAYFPKHRYWYYIYKDYLYVLGLLSTTYPYKYFTDSYPLCTQSPRHHIQPYFS